MTGYDGDELHALAELGFALVREGRWEDARTIWEGIACVAPGEETAFRMLAAIAAEEGRLAECVTLAGKAIGVRESAQALVLRGEALLRMGRFGEAVGDLERVDRVDGALGRWAAFLIGRIRRGGG